MKVSVYVVVGLLLSVAVIFAPTNEAPRTDPAFEVPKGMKAISIGVGEVMSKATEVKAGDHVDILATFQDLRTRQVITKMIMQNVLVLAINRGNTDPSGQVIARGSLTLAVRPEQTELLTAADRSGTLSILLRAVGEKMIVPPSAIEEFTAAPHEQTPVLIIPPWPSRRLGPGDFWQPGEFQRLLEEKKQQQHQVSE